MRQSIDDQIAAMAATWSDFRLVGRDRQAAVWEGTLRPYFQPFKVSVAYRAPLVIETAAPCAVQPRVRVLDPPLRPRRRDPEGQLPHVYYLGDDDLDVVLCMFDPDGDEWSPECSLAQTTVPWAADWLACYEGWRAGCGWTGTGRHLGARADLKMIP